MGNCYKNGRVVLILNGRFSGKKAIILRYGDQTQSDKSNNILLLGLKRYPQKVSRKMSKGKIFKRSRLQTFIKKINKNHIFPTRYVFDLEKKNKEVIDKKIDEFFQKKNSMVNKGESKKRDNTIFFPIDNIFMEKNFSGKNKWFFNKLRF